MGKQKAATKTAPVKPAAAKRVTKASASASRPAGKPSRPAAGKPPKSTRPSIALPPPLPAPPPHRDELAAPRDVGRLLRYGERFGPHKIDVRMLPLQLPAPSGALALFDPGVPKSWRVFDRPTGAGQFRVMLSVAVTDGKEQLAAIVIHVGRPPIAKWTVAHYRGQSRPRSPDKLPTVPVTTGWLALIDAGDGAPGAVGVPAMPAGIAPVEVPLTDGRRALAVPTKTGEYAAYWAVDEADHPICLVLDFDVFTQKDWKSKPT